MIAEQLDGAPERRAHKRPTPWDLKAVGRVMTMEMVTTSLLGDQAHDLLYQSVRNRLLPELSELAAQVRTVSDVGAGAVLEEEFRVRY